MTTWAEIGVSDPAPGDVGLLIRWSQKCGQIAEKSRSATKQLAAISTDGWVGAGATRYADLQGQTLPELCAITSAHEQACRAMKDHASLLQKSQNDASLLLARYLAARDRAESAATEGQRLLIEQQDCFIDLITASAQLRQAELTVVMDGGHHATRCRLRVSALKERSAQLIKDKTSADSAQAAAKAEMDRILGEVDNLSKVRGQSAYAAAKAIAAAVGAQLKSRNPLFRAAQDGIEGAREVISSDAFDFVVDFASSAADWTSMLAMGLAVIPGINAIATPALKTAAGVLSVVALAGLTLRALNGDETWEEAGKEAIALGIGLVLPKAFSMATKPATLAASKARIAADPHTRKLVVAVSSSLGLDYAKQAGRYYKAGGAWAGPAGRYIEKGIRVVSVLDPKLVPVSRARYYFTAAAGLKAYGTKEDLKDYAKRLEELHAYLTKTFEDEREK